MRTVEIKTTNAGEISVPAANEEAAIKNFAVTMIRFGEFDVSHIPSGYKVVGGFEMAVTALVAMAEFQLAMNELGIDCSLGYDDMKAEISERDRVTKALGITVREWQNTCRIMPFAEESLSHWGKLDELMRNLEARE